MVPTSAPCSIGTTTNMRLPATLRLLPLLAPLLLPACAASPPDADVHAAQVAIGKNSLGEDCTQQVEAGQSAAVFCGTWQQPSVRVRSGGPGAAGELAQLATSSQ